jgi:predicted transcriptional regulator
VSTNGRLAGVGNLWQDKHGARVVERVKAGRHLYIYVVVPVKQISLKSMREDLYDRWEAAFEVAQLPLKHAQTQYTE